MWTPGLFCLHNFKPSQFHRWIAAQHFFLVFFILRLRECLGNNPCSSPKVATQTGARPGPVPFSSPSQPSPSLSSVPNSPPVAGVLKLHTVGDLVANASCNGLAMSRHVWQHLCFANKTLAVHVQGHFGPQTLWHVVHDCVYFVDRSHKAIFSAPNV